MGGQQAFEVCQAEVAHSNPGNSGRCLSLELYECRIALQELVAVTGGCSALEVLAAWSHSGTCGTSLKVIGIQRSTF